jgi:dihydrodipicolinate synthase/N-acetylneuraminate lyase
MDIPNVVHYAENRYIYIYTLPRYPKSMSAAPSPANHPDALIDPIERALALRTRSEGAVDPDEVQRLLKHLKRLEPAALQALGEAGEAAAATEAQDFQACLRSLA